MLPAHYNTKGSGVMQFLIYKDGEDYIGICLNFGIEEYGEDPIKLKESLFEAAQSYLESVNKKDLSDEYLNVVPEKKYIQKLKEMVWQEELEQRIGEQKRVTVQKEPTFFSFTKQPYNEGIACAV